VNFDWDPKKATSNSEKHGVSFEEAREVFYDPLHLSILDERFSHFKERWLTTGATERGGLLVVAHLYVVEEQEERIRIVSARYATAGERKQYETLR